MVDRVEGGVAPPPPTPPDMRATHPAVHQASRSQRHRALTLCRPRASQYRLFRVRQSGGEPADNSLRPFPTGSALPFPSSALASCSRRPRVGNLTRLNWFEDGVLLAVVIVLLRRCPRRGRRPNELCPSKNSLPFHRHDGPEALVLHQLCIWAARPARALQVTKALESSLEPWLSKDLTVYRDTSRLTSGNQFEHALAQALCRILCMVLVYTPNYERSHFCLREFAAMKMLERHRFERMNVRHIEKGMIIPN
jgi:hypothetical protein